jgi:hypothetical protein
MYLLDLSGIFKNKSKESIDCHVHEFNGGFALVFFLRFENVDEALQLLLLALSVADVQLVHSLPSATQQHLQSQRGVAVVS